MEVKTWRPHPKQEQFISLPDSVFEGFYGGAAGGGKSELLLLLPLLRGFHEVPEFNGLLLRRTFPELEKSLILRSHAYYKPTGATYNSQLHRWRFPSGAVVNFGYAEHEKDVRSYDTAEFQYIGFDELTSFTEFQYKYLTSRCRTTNENLPAIIRSASNPGNVGHGWVRKRFVEPDKEGNIILVDHHGNKRIFIRALLSDNPYLLEKDPGYVSRLELLPEADKRAKLYGDWWTFSGQCFDEFRSEHFPDEPEFAIHVIEPFAIPDWWPRILAVDWGYEAMAYALWGAVSPERKCYIYREFGVKRRKIADYGAEIKLLGINDELEIQVLDPSAWSKRGDEKSIAEQLSDATGYTFVSADNDRLGGKHLVHEFLRFDEHTSPKLAIFNTCEKLINCIPLCVYEDANSDGKASEDVKEFNGDDPYDTLRYLLKAFDHFTRKSENRQAKLEEVARILKRLETTGDQTTFYRQMEMLENKNKTLTKPVRMFHRGRYFSKN